MTLKMNNFNPIRNQNYPLFFQNSPFASSFWPLNKGLFLPRLLGPKRLHSKWATLAPKLGLYFTHQNGPIFGAKTDLLDLECRVSCIALNDVAYGLPKERWFRSMLFIVNTSRNPILNIDQNLTETRLRLRKNRNKINPARVRIPSQFYCCHLSLKQ